MKLEKLLHVSSVIVGFVGIITAVVGAFAGTGLVWGLSREHLFLCSGLLMLIATWLGLSTIHHLMLDDRGRTL